MADARASRAREATRESSSLSPGTIWYSESEMEFVEFFNQIKVPMTVLHVLSVVFAMGAAVASDILFHFYGADKSLSKGEVSTLAILSRVIWYGLLIIVFSGAGIFLSDPVRYLASSKFLAKMTIMVIIIMNGIFIHFFVWRRITGKGFLSLKSAAPARRIAFVCGSISAVSWISALSLGVLDAVRAPYVSIIGMYGAILAFAIVASLIMEWYEFERPRST